MLMIGDHATDKTGVWCVMQHCGESLRTRRLSATVRRCFSAVAPAVPIPNHFTTHQLTTDRTSTCNSNTAPGGISWLPFT